MKLAVTADGRAIAAILVNSRTPMACVAFRIDDRRKTVSFDTKLFAPRENAGGLMAGPGKIAVSRQSELGVVGTPAVLKASQ